MDNADIAQPYQDIMVEQALAKMHKPTVTAHNKNADGDYECIDCDEIVEPPRVALGLTLRCISCQQQKEKKEI